MQGNNQNTSLTLSAQSDTAAQIRDMLGTLHNPPVIVCIGTDRVTGDCVGPLVGHMLRSRGVAATVLGTLREPVTALNLDETVSEIESEYAGRKVIAVDSCVGKEGELGRIRVHKGSLRPGLACGKSLPQVGDVSVTATVTEGHAADLYQVRLGLVYSLAVRIARAVLAALQQ